jgi:CRP/FNR family transcriptional regulator, cyclic AMP receptor protein
VEREPDGDRQVISPVARSQGRREPAGPWPGRSQSTAPGLRTPIPFRSRVGDHLWEELVGRTQATFTAAGAPIVRGGSQPGVTAIVSGLVRVFIWTPAGRQVPLRYARPGDLVGLAAFLAGTDMLSAEAVTDIVHVPLTLEHLRAATDRHPDLGWKIAEQVATWGMASVFSVVGAGFQQMRARVARHLLDLAIQAPDGPTVAYVTHRSLADAVGTAREVVTRVLGEFREEGVIETRAGRVVVLEPDRLARALDEESAAGPPPCDRGGPSWRAGDGLAGPAPGSASHPARSRRRRREEVVAAPPADQESAPDLGAAARAVPPWPVRQPEHAQQRQAQRPAHHPGTAGGEDEGRHGRDECGQGPGGLPPPGSCSAHLRSLDS